MPGLVAVFTAWQSLAASGQATIGYLTDGSIPASELDARLAGLRLERSDPDAAGPGTPVPVETVPLTTLFEHVITETIETEGGQVVVARYQMADPERIRGVAYFAGTAGACSLATLL
jgi:hypothetical protein